MDTRKPPEYLVCVEGMAEDVEQRDYDLCECVDSSEWTNSPAKAREMLRPSRPDISAKCGDDDNLILVLAWAVMAEDVVTAQAALRAS